MNIKFYTDENVSKAIVRGLRARGVEVLTCQEAGLLNATDTTHLDYAKQHGYVIFSHDTDFLRLHAEGTEHAGIVYAGNQKDIGGNIRNLKLIHDVLNAEEMYGKVEFI